MRYLHVKLALGFPLMVDVEFNEVLATPDEYWEQFVARCAVDADQALFVADIGNKCVGMVHSRIDDTVARVSMLYVEPNRRRQGIGTDLGRVQEEWSRAGGATLLVCHIPDESPAGPLAEELGWHRTDELFSTRRGLSERKWTKGPGPLHPSESHR